MNSPRVPLRIRQALNVEAGLNDGLSVPFLMFLIALATGTHTRAGLLSGFCQTTVIMSSCVPIRNVL